tara:strand:+ start:337 stop:498 length:162 start_codon:yes stop_codon:yes gene_type:complete
MLNNIQKYIFKFWDFLKVRKKYWLFPVIAILVLLIILIISTDGAVIAPLIYTF